MRTARGTQRLHPAWWTAILFAIVCCVVTFTVACFTGRLRSYVDVALTTDRSGLVMEPGAKVKLRGIQIGRVESIRGGDGPVKLTLQIDTDELRYVPENVGAEITATTAFGSKYVNLLYPPDPSPKRLAANAVLRSRNVSVEVNTVFENLTDLLKQINPAKLNATLTALADGLRGRGSDIGNAITAADDFLAAVNPRMGTVRQDFVALRGFADAYSTAAPDILSALSSFTTTGKTITDHRSDLDAALLSVIGLARSGTDLLEPVQHDLVTSINTLEPTTALLLKYQPSYTCLLLGAKWFLDNGGRQITGGRDGRSTILDAGLQWGSDPYRYPDNLPVVDAKGGPGGAPSCGSLPDVTKNFPVRQLITDTGFGTGLDLRPNLGIGHPFYTNYLPVTRGTPEPPSVRGAGPPAIGPVPYPGAPPYGAPLYGADGTPLYPGVPPAPSPADPAPTP